MSASYPPRRLFDGDVDLTGERSQDYTRVNPKQRRGRGSDTFITLMAVFACLAGGIGLGVWAADASQPDERAGERVSTPPTPTSTPEPLAAVVPSVAPSEAQRAVARRLASLAFDRAARTVDNSLQAGQSASAPATSTPDRPSSPAGEDRPSSRPDRRTARDRQHRWGVHSAPDNDYDFNRPFELRDRADEGADELLHIEQVDPYGQ